MRQVETKQPLSIAPLIPIFFTAIVLFLAINGPTDYIRLWNQLVNPPANSRHALRPGERRFDAKLSQKQLREYALGVEKSLKTNVGDGKSRLGMVQKIFADLKFDEKMAKEIADIFEGMNMENAKEHYFKLENFANKNLKDNKELYAKFIERSAKFVDNLLKVWKQK